MVIGKTKEIGHLYVIMPWKNKLDRVYVFEKENIVIIYKDCVHGTVYWTKM